MKFMSLVGEIVIWDVSSTQVDVASSVDDMWEKVRKAMNVVYDNQIASDLSDVLVDIPSV